MSLVITGRFVTGQTNAAGEFELHADHRQAAALVASAAAGFGVRVRAYRSGVVSGVGRADAEKREVWFDAGWADRLVILRGEAAFVFPLLHEVGHLKHEHLRGRAWERAADDFAATVMLALGYRPDQIYRGARATLAGTQDDGVHDDGQVRLQRIASQVGLGSAEND